MEEGMLVILHGWSDSAASFKRLGQKLVALGVAPQVVNVRLGDYVTLDDDVTYADLTRAMMRAWQNEPALKDAAPGSVDAVVHSTGGLVIRDWMTTYFTPASCPLKRILMLAPANFGSPLAHKGRSFVGRIVKGFNSSKPFQTGEIILKGLELASPYSFALAGRDCFARDAWYGPGRILATVLVGTKGYTGISAAANEDGGDGTVRVSTANLNAHKFSLDFSDTPSRPVPETTPMNGRTAFLRIPGENHSTIAMKDGGPKVDDTEGRIVEALRVTDADFEAYCDRLDALSESNRSKEAAETYTHGFQNTVVRLSDDAGADIEDYFLEIFAKHPSGNVDDRVTAKLQKHFINTVHPYEDNASYRSLLCDVTWLRENIPDRELYFSITAMPNVKEKGNVVGYETFGWDDIGSFGATRDDLKGIFVPDRTLLLDIKLKRAQRDKVFGFVRL